VGVAKLPFSQNSQNLWIENVHPNGESRLYGFLTQSFFDHFPEVEFFNSHAICRQHADEKSTTKSDFYLRVSKLPNLHAEPNALSLSPCLPRACFKNTF
jgi:hypothetical protein